MPYAGGMISFDMNKTTAFQLTILCKTPNQSYSRKIPFAWKPTSEEIFHSIARLRKQAVMAGVTGVVQISAVELAMVETTKVPLAGMAVEVLTGERVL